MSVFRTVAAVTAVLLTGVLAPVVIASPAVAAPNCDLGGFEIDGNLPADCDPVQDDWDTVDAAVTSSGGTYSASSKDVDATSTWVAGGNAPDKADIDTAYSYAQVGDDGHYYLYVGWTRTSNTGTGKYAIELTFSEPNIVNTPLPTPQPDRGDGGVVAYIEYQGSDLPLLGQLCEYTSQANYPASVNSDPDCTDDTTGFASAVSDDGFFFEVGFDLTEFAGIEPSCPPTIDVATMYLRSITGGSGDGNLKAFIDPLGVTPPSTCGFLDVTKESLNDLALDDPTVFDYEVSTGGDTVITDDLQIGDTDSFFTLDEGDYSLEEFIPADAPWIIDTIVCGIGEVVTIYENGDYTGETFEIVEGETTECVITNATSFVNVEKQTLPDGSPQVFDFTITDDQTFDLSDGESQGFQYAPNTEVSVTETVPADWDLTSVVCDPAGDSIENGAAVTTEPGETVDCVFTNTQRGTIIINKVVEGVDDGTFEFTSTSLGDFDITTVAGAGSEEFVVVPGEYDVAESPITGFDTTNLVCVDESGGTTVDLADFSADIDLAPGETVTCTFTNTQRGMIVVQKVTVPDAYDQDFNFTFDGNLDFTLNAAGDDEWDSGLIEPGSYSVTENDLPFGWTLDDISCGAVDDTTAVVELQPGAVVTCVFTNVAIPGEVTLTKSVTGVDDAYEWEFDFILTEEPDGAPVERTVDNSNLPDSAIATWDGLTVGSTYTLIEDDLPFGWTADDITCTGLDDADTEEDGFQFEITPGLDLECTVENQAIPAEVELTKTVSNVNPDIDWSFDFDLSGETRTATDDDPTVNWDGLIPGVQYTITEEPTPGWDLEDIVCVVAGDDGALADADAELAGYQFIATPGLVLECDVDNPADPGILTVTKSTVGGNGTFEFVLTQLGTDAEPVSAEVTTVGGTGEVIFEDIVAGYEYSIEETAPGAGWTAGPLTCEITPAGDGEPFSVDPSGFDVDPGDEIACTITNTVHAMPNTGSNPLLALPLGLAMLLLGGGGAALAIRRVRRTS